jgi:hypothetical protein
MKIDWKRKLGSRKFWALIAGFSTSVLTVVSSEATAVQVAGIITAFGSVAVYVFAEASVDRARLDSEGGDK